MLSSRPRRADEPGRGPISQWGNIGAKSVRDATTRARGVASGSTLLRGASAPPVDTPRTLPVGIGHRASTRAAAARRSGADRVAEVPRRV